MKVLICCEKLKSYFLLDANLWFSMKACCTSASLATFKMVLKATVVSEVKKRMRELLAFGSANLRVGVNPLMFK